MNKRMDRSRLNIGAYILRPYARTAACALPLPEGVKSAKLDENALALTSDSDYMEQFFLPALLPLGGLGGCLELVGCPVTVF